MVAGRKLALAVVLVCAFPAMPTGAVAADHALITAVYYDTYVTNEPDEFVRLTNPTGASIDLSGWMLTDGEGTATFPPGASLAPGQSVFVTANASAFRLDMVVQAQWEFKVDSDPSVPQMGLAGTFVLANGADEVRLVRPDGTVVDAVAYGTSPGSSGWSGAAIPDVSEGVVLERDVDELTSEHLDTDTAADWDDPRMYVVGQSHFEPASFQAQGATMFSSPDSSFEALSSFLASATSSLDITIYELRNPYLGDRIRERAASGVAVRVLVEGGPAGFEQQDRYQENWILDRVVQAGGQVRFLITNASQGIHDRYDFVHAKYALADGQKVLAMSGNWKYTGVPVDPTFGNREWGIVVDSPGLHGYLAQVFNDDWDAAHRDVLPFGQGTDWRYLPPPPDFEPDWTIEQGPYQPFFPSRSVTRDFAVEPVLVPDTSLREHSGLRELVRSARTEVLVEQMYAHRHWGDPQDGTPGTDPNLYLEDAIAAARNGAAVYVLLGDEYIDYNDTRNNVATATYLRGIAANESLDLHARIVESEVAELLKVHNKGVVVDRATAVVSSINWGRNSAQENREVALLVHDAEVAEFYRDIFWYDWAPRENRPITDLALTDVTVRDREVSLLDPLPPLHDARRHVIEVTIANLGPYGTGDFNVTVKAKPTLLGKEDTFLARVNALASGAKLTLEFPWDAPLRVGEFQLDAKVDSDDEVLERDETNNAKSIDADLLLGGLPGIAIGPS